MSIPKKKNTKRSSNTLLRLVFFFSERTLGRFTKKSIYIILFIEVELENRARNKFLIYLFYV